MSQLHPVIRKIVSGLPSEVRQKPPFQKQSSSRPADSCAQGKVSLIQIPSDVSWRSMSAFPLYDKWEVTANHDTAHRKQSGPDAKCVTTEHETGFLHASIDQFVLFQNNPTPSHKWGAIKTREQFINFSLE